LHGDPPGDEGRDTVTKKHDQDELTKEELEEQNGEQLPDREVMSVINPGVDGIASGPFPFEGAPPEPD
jgi:hypothetical protein